MAQRPASVLAIAVVLCMALEEGKGNPALEPGLAPAAGPKHLRTKRCSCNSWLDKECIYFCHLDIIWVNTPGQTSPYGLGNPSRRRKRSLSRCECSNSNDGSCSTFCQPRQRHTLGSSTAPERKKAALGSRGKLQRGAMLLRALRAVAFSNSQHTRQPRSLNKNSEGGVPWKSNVWKKRR
ncbi:endothelin-2 [Ambystoma mexicanum]|uniref:endothelin-2 n=1 Tax=Ambystoma mexicanum TaxID=8296 RepID=UPI0037E8CC5F